MGVLTREIVRRMPKVALHDHLDGGLRPATIVELARQSGTKLQSEDPAELQAWFERGAARGSLSEYLEGFAVTIGVMQSRDGLERAAYEALEDLHADGVAYAEVRFAPQYHEDGGLNVEEVVASVIAGLERAGRDLRMPWGLIICGMRGSPPALSLRMAELAVASRARGCVGFDLAGDEFGHPPKDHLKAFQFCKRENFNITIHAGEAFGPASIWQALQYCGAHRIGHATRLIEDMVIEDDRLIQMGPLAGYVLDHRVPLEICPSSNVQTGAVTELSQHPVRWFLRYCFRVTVSADNRLMSGTTTTDEYFLLHEHLDASFADLEKIAINGMKSAFINYNDRTALIRSALKPGFAALRTELGLPPYGYPGR